MDLDGYHRYPTADKTINVSIVVWLRDEGDLNYVDDPAGVNRARLLALFDYISANYFENVESPTDPAIAEVGYYLTNTRIKLHVDPTNIVFRNSTYWWSAAQQSCVNATVMDNTSAAVLADRPDLANTLMFHIVGPWSCPVTVIDPDTGLPTTVQSTGTASDPALNALAWYDQPWVVVRGSENPDVPPESQFGSIAYLWTHEIMHALGLSHVYDGSAPLSNQSFDFCNDIFSCLQQADASNPYCASAATACPPPQPWSPITFCVQDDPGDCHVTTAASPFDKCTNNVMHRSVGRHSSNLQMGRMHRSLSATFLSTSATGYNPAILGLGDWAIQEIWDFPVKLYQDLHIRRDQTLVIPCRLELVEQAKIVVEPGGLLIVDGGVITNGRYYIEEGFYNKPWRGVEVWGNSAGDQVTPSDFNIWPIENLEHQGMVIIKNGGSIENAEIGVYLGKPGDPTKAGGVLRMESTSAGPFNTIRDCRRGVKYDPCIHHVPITLGNYTGTMAVSNRSRFAHARFEFTDAFDNIHGQNNPVALNDANGIRGLLIRGCSFTNSRTDAAGSIQLGHGILAHNTTMRVTPACPDPNQNCALAVQLPSTFTDLDHAIHATSSPKRGQTVVERSTFTDNVYGVYVNGQAYPRIIGNTFTYGGRVATLDNLPDEQFWEQSHRGIFLHRCNGIRVWDNVLSEVAAPLAETEGVVVGYTTTGSETVRNNDCTNIDRAYVGEGISASTTAPASIGLQFLCNFNSADDWNIWSRIAAGDPLPIADQTIRTNQGDQTWAADNYLDNCIGSTWDLKVETATPVTYWCREDPHYEPLCINGNAFVNVQPYAPYQNCQLILVPPSNGMALQDEVEAATAAYAALRFLYANLIDGGSTDEVLDEIADAWPQDFWDLRAYLLSRSPYLSVEALKEAMNKPGFPDAMRAEICIANPEGTQQQGFIHWLVTECIAPLPEYLINNIRASWDTRTYRFALEAQMGHEHARMSEAAYMLMDLVTSDDEEGADVTEEQATMALLRSPEMRYHEAALCMGMDRFTEARTIIESLPDEHDLRGAEVIERGRMLVLIDMLEDVHLDGRSEAQLTPGEIAQFEAFIDVEHDRPTNWVSNLLCYNYGICRSPYTGDAGEVPKSLVPRPTKALPKSLPTLALQPNPANAWVVVTYDLPDAIGPSQLLVRDAMGRTMHQESVVRNAGQVLLDTRSLPAGAYVIEVQHQAVPIVSGRLILQP